MYSKLGIRLASRVSEQITTVRNVSTYGVFSGPHFPAFGLNMDRFRIQSECGKIWTRKNSVFGHFSRSVRLKYLSIKKYHICVETYRQSIFQSSQIDSLPSANKTFTIAIEKYAKEFTKLF